MTKPNLQTAQSISSVADGSMVNPGLITHDGVTEAFQDAFRRRVGRGPNKISLADLSDAIEMNARTTTAWRDGETLPQLAGLMRLFAYFGPAFTSEILSPAGLGGVETLVTVETDPQGTVTDLVSAANDILERSRDGTFCHRDRAEMAPILLELSRALEAQGNAMMRG